MKKYIFLAGIGLILLALVFKQASLVLLFTAALILWILFEDSKRRRSRFVRGKGLREYGFRLEAAPLQFEFSTLGNYLLLADRQGQMQLRDRTGRLLWMRPSEARTLAFLPTDEGAAYLALEDEFVRIDEQGRTQARLPFSPPPYRQSYRLLGGGKKGSILLQTPWYLQFAKSDLSSLEARIDSDSVGHYMKYCALAPGGDSVYMAGAKLLEDENSSEARWSCWRRDQESWKEAWRQSIENYGNSHLRGLWLDPAGKQILLETYLDGYSLQLLDENGKERWRRPGGEHACFGAQGDYLLWENPFEGLTLTRLEDFKSLWTFKTGLPPRYKTLLAGGDALLWLPEGWLRIGLDGKVRGKISQGQNAQRFGVSAKGDLLFLADESYGALLQLEAL